MARVSALANIETVTDHVAEALAVLSDPGVLYGNGMARESANPNDFAVAQVHATLAVAQSVSELADVLREVLDR